MKNILFTILTLITISTFAQQDVTVSIHQKGRLEEEDNLTYYYKDLNNDLDKFLGTWKYIDTNKELTVTFYQETNNYCGNSQDELYAKFTYSENGILVYNTFTNYRPNKKISGAFFDDINKMELFYDEPSTITYRRTVNPPILKIEFLGSDNLSGQPLLKWDLEYNTHGNEVWPFRIPKNLILTRQ